MEYATHICIAILASSCVSMSIGIYQLRRRIENLELRVDLFERLQDVYRRERYRITDPATWKKDVIDLMPGPGRE